MWIYILVGVICNLIGALISVFGQQSPQEKSECSYVEIQKMPL